MNRVNVGVYLQLGVKVSRYTTVDRSSERVKGCGMLNLIVE